MSMKVYDGYVWEGEGGLEGLLRALGGFVEPARSACRDAVAAQLGRKTAGHLDRIALGMAPDDEIVRRLNGGNVLKAVTAAAEADRAATLDRGYRSHENDWECTVQVIIVPGHAPLLRLVAEKGRVYAPVFAAIPGIRAYPAWDNTDGPEDIPRAEWEARVDLWRSTFGHGTGRMLTRHPLCLHVVEERGFDVGPLAVVAAQPSLADRCAPLARDMLLERRMAEDIAARPGHLDPEQSWKANTRAFWAFEAWSRTAEGEAALSDEAAGIAALLPARYSFEDMLGWKPREPIDGRGEGPAP
jgi:hypothetical protein